MNAAYILGDSQFMVFWGKNHVDQRSRTAMWVLGRKFGERPSSASVRWPLLLSTHCPGLSANAKSETPGKPHKAHCFLGLPSLLLEGSFIVGMASLSPESHKSKCPAFFLSIVIKTLISGYKNNTRIHLSSETIK